MYFKQDGLTEKMVDIKAEYGRLTFLKMKRTNQTSDNDGEGEGRSWVYNVLSDKKQDIVRVYIPGDLPQVQLENGVEIELVNPRIRPRIMTDAGTKVIVPYLYADNITPTAATNPGQPQPKPKPEQPKADK